MTNPSSDKGRSHLLGARLVEHRTTRGWKQRELSRRSAIEPGRLSRIERGIAFPNLEELARLKTVFGTSLDDLVFGQAPAGPDGSLDQLVHEVGRLAAREEIAILRRFFHLLVLGYRHEQKLSTRGDHA